MSVRLQYMGAKRRLAGDVAALIGELEPGSTVVDLFCGTCSVAGSISSQGRPTWVNDVQRYAVETARCVLTSAWGPPPWDELWATIEEDLVENLNAIERRFPSDIAEEDAVLAEPSTAAYHDVYVRWRHVANDLERSREAAAMAATPEATPYRMATLTFAWGYLGLRQCIALDSIRCGIDRAERLGRLQGEQARWARLALLQAASRLATGPGHLAQYLSAASESSLERVIRQRRRDLLAQFRIELTRLAPFGEASWRARNRVFASDALAIWPQLYELRVSGGVVYADPPYSKNQYSRFYHVLETLTRYDYPSAAGRGRYRPDRFITGFCRRREVEASFEALCTGVAYLGCTLVLSYPANGLLRRVTGAGPESVLRRCFSSTEVALSVDIDHSTLGAGHGRRDHSTREFVYVAR